MSRTDPTLHLLCGKIASGKSTLAKKLAQSEGAVLISEDDWLFTLYDQEMASIQDYMRCASKLRQAMHPHIVSLLNAGVSVILDFQANTVESRSWMRDLIDQTGAYHQMHVLMPSDVVCLARLRVRNASGDHPFSVSEEQFHQISGYFTPPTPDEGLNVIKYE